MKKFLTFTTLLLLSFILVACSNNKSSSSSSSSKVISSSKTSTRSSSSSAATQEMNLEQIASGDYSSIQGTWENNVGKTLIFSADTITLDGNPVNILSHSFYNNKHLSLFPQGYGIDFVAVGEKNQTAGVTDVSDTSKDRIYVGQVWKDGSDAFYKVN